ncbi:hypothetical protein FQN54_002344 [Arachnomyces sp. PD_36]|nr:hypothetical protein FQN54_002344 [Arachnomyces sp. PD_36]
MSILGPKESRVRDKDSFEREMKLQTLLFPNYAEERENTIKMLQGLIRDGFNVGYAKEKLEWLLDNTPCGPILDPAEPKGLDKAVYCRIEILKYLRDGAHKEDVKNIDAVLGAYRTGNLKVVPGQASYWRNGTLKRDLGPYIPDSELVAFQEKWISDDNTGRNWIEEVTVHPQLANHAAIPPCDIHHHHIYSLNVKLIGSATTIRVPVLDDTGSTYLSLYETTDFAPLGLNANYQYFQGEVVLSSPNGNVVFNSVLVEAQLAGPDNTPLGPVTRTRAIIMPQRAGQPPYGTRLSGMFLRSALFTGTAPDGSGRLFLAEKKNGIANYLPSV